MSNYNISVIVFDMAGTVVNEKNVVYKTLQKALGVAGYNFSLQEVLANAGGKEKHQAIKDLMNLNPKNGELTSQEVYDRFLTYLTIAYQDLSVSSYPGVERMLLRLRKKAIKVVFNTGYNYETAYRLLEKMQWKLGLQYDLLVAADQVENSRPAPDMIQLAMKELDIDNSSQVAKVGDSVIDIEEGKFAGCGVTVAVTTGAHTKEQLSLANPTFLLDSLANLDELIFDYSPRV